jgi:hypothetical protein
VIDVRLTANLLGAAPMANHVSFDILAIGAPPTYRNRTVPADLPQTALLARSPAPHIP